MNSRMVWRKSSYSTQDTACVEVALAAHSIATRDSKRADSPQLAFQDTAWLDFIGEFRRRV